jgi:hypothetical protein
MRRASGGDGGSDRDDSADAHDETASERHVPVGRRGGTADFGRAVAVVTACILGPSASALLAADSIGLYLTAVEFSLLAVAGLGPVAWTLLVGTDTDHVDFAAAAVVTPAVLFVLAAVTAPVWNDQTPPDGVLPAQSGTYRVRVVSLSGVVVDRARYTADTGSRLAVEAVSVSRGEPPADCSADTVERRALFVCVVVSNRGEFPTFAAPTLVVPGENQYSGTTFLESGETSGVLFSLSNDTVERVRSRQNGTVTVALWRSGHADERVDTATVELPPASSEEVASRLTTVEATTHGLTTAEIA